MNRELPNVQVGFRKGRGTRDQIANICCVTKKAREFQKVFIITNMYLTFSVLLFTRSFYFRPSPSGVSTYPPPLSNLSRTASYATTHHPRLSVIHRGHQGETLSATGALEFPNWFQGPVTSGHPPDSSMVDIQSNGHWRIQAVGSSLWPIHLSSSEMSFSAMVARAMNLNPRSVQGIPVIGHFSGCWPPTCQAGR